jgi:glycosyltransferase involved in cell wall biosynthesis
MKVLLACEFYYPSRGGVQEVMRQIAERLALQGHDVTVATTRHPDRQFSTINGVKVVEFDISGNRVNGMVGEVKKYQEFLRSFNGDALMVKAAQQWTFDATWEILDEIVYRKVFIPCGFSGYFLPEYKNYFKELPSILKKWDHLIFYAERYRDIDFVRRHGLTKFSILPNAASEIEFSVDKDKEFRNRHGIGSEEFVIITVGTPINAKGHTELAAAFSRINSKGRKFTLILNGHWPEPAQAIEIDSDGGSLEKRTHFSLSTYNKILCLIGRSAQVLRAGGVRAFSRRFNKWLFFRSRQFASQSWILLSKPFKPIIFSISANPDKNKFMQANKTIEEYIHDAQTQSEKKVLCTNLERTELVQAFLNSDLFVFASNIEYSPLVLFEAAAAGLPFISVPVGNADEIVNWTRGGVICPSEKDEFGYTRVDPDVLAARIEQLVENAELRTKLGMQGKESWSATYNWASVVPRYARILAGE